MAISGQTGVKLPLAIADGDRRDAAWFGEAPSRILLAISPDKVESVLNAGLPDSVFLTELGIFEGDLIQLDVAQVPVTTAAQTFDSALRSESGEA